MFKPEDAEKLAKLGPVPMSEIDDSGMTVEFFRTLDRKTKVIFTIPDSAQVLSRNPHEFMQWCYNEMMNIVRQAESFK
jgi:hypothetical protein